MVTAEEFVKTWQAAKSLDEVAEKLESENASVSTRASYYRKKGVPLKKFREGGQLDVAALKKLCKNGD